MALANYLSNMDAVTARPLAIRSVLRYIGGPIPARAAR